MNAGGNLSVRFFLLFDGAVMEHHGHPLPFRSYARRCSKVKPGQPSSSKKPLSELRALCSPLAEGFQVGSILSFLDSMRK